MPGTGWRTGPLPWKFFLFCIFSSTNSSREYFWSWEPDTQDPRPPTSRGLTARSGRACCSRAGRGWPMGRGPGFARTRVVPTSALSPTPPDCGVSGATPGLCLSYATRAPYSGNRKPEGALRPRTARPSPGKLCVRSSRVPPSGPPQVFKEAQRLLRSLLLPSPVGVATWPSRARPSLHLIHSCTDPLLPGSLQDLPAKER